jgi:AGCS family alanine or glycine:cation symporter
MSLTDSLQSAISTLSSLVFFAVPVGGVKIQLIVLWLAVAMLFATLWLGFPQWRGFREGWHIVRGRYHDPSAPGEVSQFAALATALSGTVGLGNIAGVAVAVSTGGPGAVFWMFVIGLFAMALKCAEVTLGLMYRDVLPGGAVRGGPFVTLTNGLAAIGRPRLGRSLGTAYAFFLLGGSLSLFQVNQSYAQVAAVSGFTNSALFGIGFAVLTALVVLGSVRWIARTTSVLVPLMAATYIGGCLVILAGNAAAIPAAVASIVGEAFNTQSAFGGILGAFVVGMRRAVYSSEAGVGTAVIAHAQAKTREPASEGLVALLEPFIDTVVICTLTGLTVVVAGNWNPATNGGLEGVAITSSAFATIAPWFPAVLAVAVFLFAYSTVIANGFYGAEGFQHLFGRGRVQELGWKIGFCCILPLGAILNVSTIVDFVDSVYFLMAIPNIIGLYLLAGPLRSEMNRYLADHAERSTTWRNS